MLGDDVYDYTQTDERANLENVCGVVESHNGRDWICVRRHHYGTDRPREEGHYFVIRYPYRRYGE